MVRALPSGCPAGRPGKLKGRMPEAFCIACAWFALGVACSERTPGAPTTARVAASTALRDDLGRDVQLAAPARRIASLSPALTEVICAVGCCERLVLRDRWSDAPAAATAVTAVDALSPSAEQILAARPDLVLVSFPNGRLRGALDAAGVPWAALSPRDLPGIAADLRRVGALCGEPAGARAAVAAFEAALARVPRLQGPAPRVYLELDHAGGKAWTSGGDAFTSALIVAAGGRNAMAALRGWPQISSEAILTADPDVVLLAWPGAAEERDAVAAFAGRPGLATLRAVRLGRVYRVDAALLGRPGPRAPAAVAAIARLLAAAPRTAP